MNGNDIARFEVIGWKAWALLLYAFISMVLVTTFLLLLPFGITSIHFSK